MSGAATQDAIGRARKALETNTARHYGTVGVRADDLRTPLDGDDGVVIACPDGYAATLRDGVWFVEPLREGK